MESFRQDACPRYHLGCRAAAAVWLPFTPPTNIQWFLPSLYIQDRSTRSLPLRSKIAFGLPSMWCSPCTLALAGPWLIYIARLYSEMTCIIREKQKQATSNISPLFNQFRCLLSQPRLGAPFSNPMGIIAQVSIPTIKRANPRCSTKIYALPSCKPYAVGARPPDLIARRGVGLRPPELSLFRLSAALTRCSLFPLLSTPSF